MIGPMFSDRGKKTAYALGLSYSEKICWNNVLRDSLC